MSKSKGEARQGVGEARKQSNSGHAKPTAGRLRGRLRDKAGRFKPHVKPMEEPNRNAQESTPADKPMRPSQCRGHLRRELADAFPAILRGFVKQAASGSVQHLKLTTELLQEPGTQRRQKGSAQRLLEQLDRMQREHGIGADEAPSGENDGW